MADAAKLILGASKRRDFLKLFALGGVATILPVVITGCGDDVTDPMARATFAFNSDHGALNLAYAYAQFMADFYARVVGNKYVGITSIENSRLTTINNQKHSQRDALQKLISSGRITDTLLFDYRTFDFSSRSAVMGFAQTFEDLGVSALVGTAQYVRDATNLTLLGQVTAVWARHAAVIRDLNDISAGATRTSFAASADSNGLEPLSTPSAVVAQLQSHFLTALSVSSAA